MTHPAPRMTTRSLAIAALLALPLAAGAHAQEEDRLKMGAGCPALGSMPSPNVQDLGSVTFVSAADRAVTLYWLDFDGMPVEYAGLLPGEEVSFESYAGHRWIAKDFSWTCHGGVIEVPFGRSTITIY